MGLGIWEDRVDRIHEHASCTHQHADGFEYSEEEEQDEEEVDIENQYYNAKGALSDLSRGDLHVMTEPTMRRRTRIPISMMNFPAFPSVPVRC